MPAVAAVLDLSFLLAAFGLRTFVQRRRTGDAGWRLGRPHGTAELVARLLLVGAAGLLALSLFTAPSAERVSVLAVTGVGLAAGAMALTVVAQLQMGAEWRVGVDPEERTELIRSGLYAHTRNPIYLGMTMFAVGQAAMLPGLWSIAASIAMVVGVEIQVRAVEEPYLRATHGPAYEDWARRAGRFVPGLGLVRSRGGLVDSGRARSTLSVSSGRPGSG